MRNLASILIVTIVALFGGYAVSVQAAVAMLPKEKKMESAEKSGDDKGKADERNKEEQKNGKPEEKKDEQATTQGKVEKVVVDMSYDGLDVSRHQKDIDWEEVAKDKNVKYVYVKATEGATFVDPRYYANIEGAHRVGIKVGAYHFLRTGTRVQDQFDNFTRTVKKNEQDLIPLLDVEVKQGWSNQQLRDSVKLFLDLLEDYYGCKPMIYTSSSFFNTILGRAFVEYPLFIARYATNEPRLDNGAQWIMWQFSEKGRVRGIDHAVDLSRFNKGRSLRDILIKDNKLGHRKRKTTEVVDKSIDKPSSINVKKEAPVMSAQQERELLKKQEKEQKARERAEKLAREDAQKKKSEQKKKSDLANKSENVKIAETSRSQELDQTRTSSSPKPVRRKPGSTTNSVKETVSKLMDFSSVEDKVEKEAKVQAEKEAKAQAEAEAKARKQAAKEKAAREKAAREQAARERAAKEKAEREAEKKVEKLVKEEIERQEKAEAEAAREQARQQAIAEKRAKAQAKAKAELEKEAQEEAAKKAQQQKRQETKAKLQQQKAVSAGTSTPATNNKSTSTPTKKRTNKSSADND